MDRKTFIQQSALGTLGVLVAPQTITSMQKNIFVHHVYFWLKDPKARKLRRNWLRGWKAWARLKPSRCSILGSRRTPIGRLLTVLMPFPGLHCSRIRQTRIHTRLILFTFALWNSTPISGAGLWFMILWMLNNGELPCFVGWHGFLCIFVPLTSSDLFASVSRPQLITPRLIVQLVSSF